MKKNILENFAGASTYQAKKGVLTEEKRKNEHEKEIQSGIKNFYLKVLGWWGRSTTKSIDELAVILSETNILSDKKDTDEFIRKLYEKCNGIIEWDYNNYLVFTPIKNEAGIKECRIEHREKYPDCIA